jgi:hypothetical protein
MNNTKKNLLIFFGEYRTFEYIIPQLENLDKVDVIFSTWSTSKVNYVYRYEVTRDKILSILPSIKHIYITEKTPYTNKHNTWKMYWHWKNVINNIENHEEYENVILHRCDLVSDWHKVLELDIEDNTLYISGRPGVIEHIDKHSGIFVNDYWFFGKFDIIKKFVNGFNKENYVVPHFPIWDVIEENNIKYSNLFIIKCLLIRDYHIEFVDYLNSNNLKLLDISEQSDGKLYRFFEDLFLTKNFENRK